jgi:cytochrome c oxidase cbb3-type subunit 3
MSDYDEGRPLLPHNYDGIEEFDNPLPFWWVLLFWITIVFSVGYWAYYHLGDGASVLQAYDREMKGYFDQQAEQMAAAGAISEESLRGMMSNDAVITTAKAAFTTRCVVCHGEKAEGKIGPNLTDQYWIHGGKLTEIYHTISEGVLDKGMISWKTQLTPSEMMGLAALVGTLQGTNPPNPKPPQGNHYDPNAAGAVPAGGAPTGGAPATGTPNGTAPSGTPAGAR